MRAGLWTRSDGVRTWPADAFTTKEVLARKGARLVSVVIPAKNEAVTVAGVVEPLHAAHGRRTGSGLLDEIVVVDDGSSDRTAVIARAAGATVHRLARSGGKGRAMVVGAEVASGDIVVFLDADVLDTSPRWLPQLLGPLLSDPTVELVKGFYDRPLEGRPTGGGRVTELAARPVLSLLYPDLADIFQPLAGETAARRSTILEVGIEPDYGAELGLLIDIARRAGAHGIAQVDLGTRTHRNRPLSELGAISRDVLRVALTRAGVATAPSD
jgi:glucosyl-3-phosphoglycerate synthase